MQEFSDALDAFEADHSPQGRVLRAGLDLIETMGIDKVTVAAILGEAKVARGTVYAHFGDVFGVFATAWSALGQSWLHLMMTETEDSAIPTAYRSALVQILCAARRAPVLGEVVQPDVDQVWAALVRTEPAAELRAAWLLSMRVAQELSIAILPESSKIDPVIAGIAAMPGDVSARYGLDGVAPFSFEMSELGSPFDAEPDPITRRLMVAAVDVVASSGLASASMLRVCRAARLTPGAAAPRFSDLRTLHDYSFSGALSDVVRQNRSLYLGTTAGMSLPDGAAAVTLSSITAERLKWRRYRQEFHIAAITDPALAEMMRKAITTTDPESLEALRTSGASDSLLELMILFVHVAASGIAAVDALGIPLGDLDHRPVFRWLYENLTGTAVVGVD